MSTFVDERRFAPAVRQWHGNSHGPSREWDTHTAFARLLFAEAWPIHEIAHYLGCDRAFVLAAVEEDLP